jgi:hypothetical protein
VIFQPIGHAESSPYLRRTLECKLALAVPGNRVAKIMRLADQDQKGGPLPVPTFLALFVLNRASAASTVSFHKPRQCQR